MLFEFHKTQNTKKPKSIHATYLITGRKKPVITRMECMIKMEPSILVLPPVRIWAARGRGVSIGFDSDTR
jgi:hypothetical protein